MTPEDKIIPKFTQQIRCIDQELVMAFALEHCEAGIKMLNAVIKTEWCVAVNGKERLRTESLSAAIRAYNEVNNE